MKTETLEHQVKEFGVSAVSTARTRVIGVFNGKEFDRESMETIVLSKENDDWKIVHIHWSD